MDFIENSISKTTSKSVSYTEIGNIQACLLCPKIPKFKTQRHSMMFSDRLLTPGLSCQREITFCHGD